jgi:ADP-ribose pyrophosphatase YjhB (NUDIX family)
VRSFRHSPRNWHREIPRGFGAAGESREQTARRELKEEIGVRMLGIEPLGPLRMEIGMVGDPPQLFWAEVSEPSFIEQEEGLDDVLLAASADLDRLMTQGLLDDAFTLAAIAYARVRGCCCRRRPSAPTAPLDGRRLGPPAVWSMHSRVRRSSPACPRGARTSA